MEAPVNISLPVAESASSVWLADGVILTA